MDDKVYRTRAVCWLMVVTKVRSREKGFKRREAEKTFINEYRMIFPSLRTYTGRKVMEGS